MQHYWWWFGGKYPESFAKQRDCKNKFNKNQSEENFLMDSKKWSGRERNAKNIQLWSWVCAVRKKREPAKNIKNISPALQAVCDWRSYFQDFF